MKDEPILTVATVGRLIEIALILLPLFGLKIDISPEQQGALAVAIVATGGVIESFVQRSQVKPLSKLQPKAE